MRPVPSAALKEAVASTGTNTALMMTIDRRIRYHLSCFEKYLGCLPISERTRSMYCSSGPRLPRGASSALADRHLRP